MVIAPARSLLALLFRARFALSPPSDFVLTGLPRSGTSLLATLLSASDDCFCFNEIFYDVQLLPYFLARMRHRLRRGEPVPVKVDGAGELVTDTMNGGVLDRKVAFAPKNHGVVVGSNVNVPYLDRIDVLLGYRYPIVAALRDPVYTLASWNSAKASTIPEARVTDDDMADRWRGWRFAASDKEGRQAELWEHYTGIILSLGERAHVVRYEALCDDTSATLAKLCDYLSIEAPREISALRNLNVDDRFGPLDAIRAAVRKHCPSRHRLGYA